MNTDKKQNTGSTIESDNRLKKEKSSWFLRGQHSKKCRIPIHKTIIGNLRIGSKAYDDFIAGYDNPNA